MFEKLIVSILLKLGDKLIEVVAELFKKFIKDQKDASDVKNCLDIKDPIKRQHCLSNELNS